MLDPNSPVLDLVAAEEPLQDSNICKTCGLKQLCVEGEPLTFEANYGPPLSVERAFARVCKYAGTKPCLNQSIDPSELTITKDDNYGRL